MLIDLFTELHSKDNKFFLNLNVKTQEENGKTDVSEKNQLSAFALLENKQFLEKLSPADLRELMSWAHGKDWEADLLKKIVACYLAANEDKDQSYIRLFSKDFLIEIALLNEDAAIYIIENLQENTSTRIAKHLWSSDSKEILKWLIQLASTHLHISWELFCGKHSYDSWADLRRILIKNPQELINILHTLPMILVSGLDYSKFNNIFYKALTELENENINENYAALASNEILAERILSRYFLNLKSDSFKVLNLQTLVNMGLKHPKLAEMIIRLAPKKPEYTQYFEQLLKNLLDSAENLHQESQLTQALLLFAGITLKKDTKKAVSICMQLTEKGFAPASDLLSKFAECFASGKALEVSSGNSQKNAFTSLYPGEILGDPVTQDSTQAAKINEYLLLSRFKQTQNFKLSSAKDNSWHSQSSLKQEESMIEQTKISSAAPKNP